MAPVGDDFGFQPASQSAAPAQAPAQAPSKSPSTKGDFGFTPIAQASQVPEANKPTKDDFGFTPTASPLSSTQPATQPSVNPQHITLPQSAVGGLLSSKGLDVTATAPGEASSDQPWPQWFESSLEAANKYLVEPFNKMAEVGKEAGAASLQGLVTGKSPFQAELEHRINPEAEGTGTGIARGIGGVVGGAITDPRNWPLMGAGEAAPLLQRLISGGFGVMMGHDAIEKLGDLKDNWDKLTPEQRAEGLTQAGTGVLMTGMAGTHAIMGGKVHLTPEEFDTAQQAVQDHMEAGVREGDVAKVDDAVEAWKVLNAKRVQGVREGVGEDASGTGDVNNRPATGEATQGPPVSEGERFRGQGNAQGPTGVNTPPPQGAGAENLRGDKRATGREGDVGDNPVASALKGADGRQTPERLLSVIEPSFQDVLRMGRGEEGPGLADAVISRGVTGAPPELEDRVETPQPVLSPEVDRDLSNGGIKVIKGGEDISLLRRYLGSLSQSARSLNNPVVSAISSRIADTTIGIARNTADTLTGFRKEVRRNVTPEEWDKVVTLLDDPKVSKGNLPAGTPSKVERAYNYTRDLLDKHRVQARDAKRLELVNGGMTKTRAEQLVPDDWGIKDGYYVHAFPGNWTITEHGGVDAKGNDIWNPIDTGWRTETLSQAQVRAEEYLMNNPGVKLKVQLDNVSLPGKGITDKNRLQALHDEIKQASAQVYNGAPVDQVMGDLKNASARLNFGPRRVAPKGFGAVAERESNLPGWARDLDNFERYIMGMERYLQLAPARAEIFKYRNLLAKMTNMPDVLKPADLPKRYSGQMANILGRVDASIEALEGYPTGFDSAVRNSLQRIGLDPNLLNNAYSVMNSAEALLKLGFNPASAGLHLAQTIAATYPVLGEKWTAYGIAQAYSSKYSSLVHDLGIEATSNLMDIDSYKSYRTGYIKGITQATGPAEAIKNIAGTAYQDMQTTGLYAFSKGVETARRVAAVGAYEKAVSEGKGPQAARDYARDVLHRTQFNYSAADQPTVLRKTPRLFTQFKNFTLKMGEFVLGLRGAELARFMIGMGIIGYAGLPALQSISNGIEAVSGYNPEQEFKRALPRFSRGALGYAGIDYTKNIGFGDWLGGDSLKPSHLLGPGISDIGNVISAIAASVGGPSRKGEQSKEELWNISPEVKRLHDEGIRLATTPSKVDPRTGATIIKNLTPMERLETLMGFTPIRVAEERDTHEYIRQQLESVKDKRGYFIDKLAETQVELSRPDLSEADRTSVLKDIVDLQKAAQAEGLGPGLVKAVKIRAREMMMERLSRDLKSAPKSQRFPVYNEIQRYQGEVGDASR